MAKNSTNSPYPIPVNALLIPTITFQMSPPLNVSGVCVSSVQISASLSFQPDRAFSNTLTTQLSLIGCHLLAPLLASHGETRYRGWERTGSPGWQKPPSGGFLGVFPLATNRRRQAPPVKARPVLRLGGSRRLRQQSPALTGGVRRRILPQGDTHPYRAPRCLRLRSCWRGWMARSMPSPMFRAVLRSCSRASPRSDAS